MEGTFLSHPPAACLSTGPLRFTSSDVLASLVYSQLEWFRRNYGAVKATRIPLFPSYYFLASAHLSVCCVPTRLRNTNTQRLSLLSVITLLHLQICPSACLCARQPHQNIFPLSLSLGCRMEEWHLRVTGQKQAKKGVITFCTYGNKLLTIRLSGVFFISKQEGS